MYTIKEKDVNKERLAGRDYKLLFGPTVLGASNLCGGVSFFPPRAHAPGHIHKDAEEVIYVLKGHGELVIGRRRERLSPGTIGYIPRGRLHSINNTGKVTIKLLFMFSPPIEIGKYKDVRYR